MVLAYGFTTPLGQAIGLIVHKMYDPASMGGLLVVGFMNAISSGLLLYAGLVQLLAEGFLTDGQSGVLVVRTVPPTCSPKLKFAHLRNKGKSLLHAIVRQMQSTGKNWMQDAMSRISSRQLVWCDVVRFSTVTRS